MATGIRHGAVLVEARRILERKPPARCTCENKGAGEPALHSDVCELAVAFDLAMDEALEILFAYQDEEARGETYQKEVQDELD